MEVSLITSSEVRGIIREELTKFREAIELSTLSESQKSPDERLTRHEICKLYKISLPTVHQCMKQGLPYEKLGRKTLFRRSDVDEFFRKRKGGLK